MLRDNLIMLRNYQRIFAGADRRIGLGISRQAYAKWESGATVPDIEKCQKLAEVYGITLDGLVKTETLDGGGVIPPAPKGKNIWGSVTMNERGQLVIPKAAREHFESRSWSAFYCPQRRSGGDSPRPGGTFRRKNACPERNGGNFAGKIGGK